MNNIEDALREIERIKTDDAFAQSVYAALCNVNWTHESGQVYSCTWRYAGGLVAEVRDQHEDYMDFYCSGIGRGTPEGTITPEVAAALSGHGWRGEPM